MTGLEWSLSLHLLDSKQAEGRFGYGFCEWLRIVGMATFALDFPHDVICQWNFTNSAGPDPSEHRTVQPGIQFSKEPDPAESGRGLVPQIQTVSTEGSLVPVS